MPGPWGPREERGGCGRRPLVSWEAGSEGGKVCMPFRGLGCQSFCRAAIRKLGKASAVFIWADGIVLPLNQSLHVGSRVTLESSLYHSELSALVGSWGSSSLSHTGLSRGKGETAPVKHMAQYLAYSRGTTQHPLAIVCYYHPRKSCLLFPSPSALHVVDSRFVYISWTPFIQCQERYLAPTLGYRHSTRPWRRMVLEAWPLISAHRPLPPEASVLPASWGSPLSRVLSSLQRPQPRTSSLFFI